MNRQITLGVLLSAGFFNSAQAEGFLKSGPSVFNYDYVDVTYVDGDGADGVALEFSADFNDNYALNVGYSKLDSRGFDIDTLAFGVTYHIQTGNYPQADWVVGAGLQTFDSGNNDDTGLILNGGIRYAINDSLEANGALLLSTVGDTDITIHLRGLYEFATGFSGLLETFIGDGSSIGLGVRFYWR